jgi:hypothetical protein
VRPPWGQAGTGEDSEGQDAEDRGLTEAADSPDRPGADPERRSVSALVADALRALDRGDVTAARAVLRDVAARLALPGRR